MKKLFSIFMSVVLIILVSGCSNNTSTTNESAQYKQYMADGKSSVVDEEYDKAIQHFELALEEKKDDKEATNLIKQLKLLKEAIELNEGESGVYFSSIEKLEKLEKIKTDTDIVKKKAMSYKESVLINIDSTIDYDEELIEKGDYETAKRDLESNIDECKKYDCLKKQLARCEELLKKCNTKFEESKAAKNEQYADQGDTVNGKVYCFRRNHYVDPENLVDSEVSGCKGCVITRQLVTVGFWEDCSHCGAETNVNPFTGVCENCGTKVSLAIKNVKDDGTIVYEDGSTDPY